MTAPDPSGPIVSRGDDAASLGRLQARDAGAFEALFRDHYHGLCVYAARFVATVAIAEELVQDMPRVRHQRECWTVTGSVAAYLYGAVSNLALPSCTTRGSSGGGRIVEERSHLRRPVDVNPAIKQWELG